MSDNWLLNQKPSLNLSLVPDELKFSKEEYIEILRFIDEYLHSADFKEGESAYDCLSDIDKVTVTNWALRIYNRSSEVAPSITKTLKEIISSLGVGVELLGYNISDFEVTPNKKNNTIKSIDSLKRKIIHDANLFYNDDYNMSGSKIRDGIRYTVIIHDDIYLDIVDKILQQLASLGYQIDLKNHWVDASNFWTSENKDKWMKVGCQGINAKIVCPNNLDVFEIQFHTPMEHQIKEGSTRDLYKVLRDASLELEWILRLERYRTFLQSTIVPPDTESLKACDYRFVANEKRR